MSTAIRSFSRLALVLVAVFGAAALALPPSAHAQKKVLNVAAKEPESMDPHTSILGQSQAIFRFTSGV